VYVSFITSKYISQEMMKGKYSEVLPEYFGGTYFDIMKDTYTTDDLQIAFAIGHLCACPSTWAYSLVRNKDPVLDSWINFKAERDFVVDVLRVIGTAVRTILVIRSTKG
jgi:hypothetical protein